MNRPVGLLVAAVVVVAVWAAGAAVAAASIPFSSYLWALDAPTAKVCVAVGAQGKIVRTADRGATWHASHSGTTVNLWSVDFVDARYGWAVGSGGIILKSTDGGAHWKRQRSGTKSQLERVDFVSRTCGYIAGGITGKGVLLKTTNGGAAWKRLKAPTGPYYSVSFADATHGWVLRPGWPMLRTANGGRTWKKSQLAGGGETNLNDVKCVGRTHVWVCGDFPSDEAPTGVFAKVDGHAWTQQYDVPSGGFGEYAIDFADTTHGFVAETQGLYLKTTDGSTWVEHTLSELSSEFLFDVSMSSDNVVWILTTDGSIARTSDGGDHWTLL